MATVKPNEEPIIVSFMTIRKGVGVLGILMPFLLVAGLAFIFKEGDWEPSLSHYYYTRMGAAFVGTLCVVAFFLYCYRGYDRADRVTSRLAALFALIVAFFPADPAPLYSVMNFDCAYWVHVVHFVSASLMFLVFAYISIFLFTKTDAPEPGRRKRQRNRVFRVCGVLMLVALVGILLDATVPSIGTALAVYHPILVLEAIALWAFGLSWLVKGQGMLKD
jgi:hypothetical protein